MASHSHSDKVATFRSLHVPGRPLLMPNPWDQGSARLLLSLGFQALATTSSGFAATLGRLDGSVTRDEALAHAASIVGAVDAPVSADLENGFADDPDAVAETAAGARAAGLAGFSIEDFTGDQGSPIYEPRQATERVAAAAEAAHRSGDTGLVLTGRAENLLHGVRDLADTIARLQAYQEAGADVLFAPGLRRIEDVRQVMASVDRPVNVLLFPGGPTVAELAEVGVARISVGGAFSYVALGATARAARELLESGTYGMDLAAEGRQLATAAFGT
ncbi:MAG: isocitrate lyase/phosphoenolpyruvate mutase family protein [Actinobacteria bacterium]|nr:MAG: isocitrate lyase/phosphoenolpyruvate mutase family protein [Actinomycetota bacterium]